MSVEVWYAGRLGNNLFQYALGRIIAEAKGYALNCGTPPGLPRKSLSPATLPRLYRHFQDAPQRLPGTRIRDPQERYVMGDPQEWTATGLDLNWLLADPTPRKIVLHGWFQRMDFFAPHSGSIRRWFAFRQPTPAVQIGPRDVVVNLRRGADFYQLGWILSLDYYGQILETLSFDRLFICGTGIDDQIKAYFARYNPVYFSSTPIEELKFLRSFNTIIQSNSTFCWWAAFLSDAEHIYGPRPIFGPLGPTAPEIDLEVKDPRFHYVSGVKALPFRPFQVDCARSPQWITKKGKKVLSIPRPKGAPVGVRFNDDQVPFARWILRQREPFGPMDYWHQLDRILSTVGKRELVSVLERMVELGVLSFDDQRPHE